MARNIVLKSYEEVNKDRKRLRIIFAIASLPFIVVIGLFVYKASTMYLNANHAIEQYEQGNYSESIKYAEKQKTTNFLEQWLAYYNTGTALGKNGEWKKAVKELTKALELSVGTYPAECQVRANLAISYEKLGDEAMTQGDNEAAEKFYWQSSAIVMESPQECIPESSGGDAEEDSESEEAGESLIQTKERSEEKGMEARGEEPEESEEKDEGTPEEVQPEKSDRDQVQDQLDQSAEDRADFENAEEGKNNTPVDKPW